MTDPNPLPEPHRLDLDAAGNPKSVPSWLTPGLLVEIQQLASEMGLDKARQMNQSGDLVREAERRLEEFESETSALAQVILERKHGTNPVQAMAEATEMMRAKRQHQDR